MKLLTALLFVLLPVFQISAQVIYDAETFEMVMPWLKEKTRVPVLLPTYLNAEDEKYPLYAMVKDISPTRYEVRISFTRNCAGEQSCYYGFVSGGEITGMEMPPGNTELAQGKRGYYDRRDSTISWDENGYRYTIGIKGANLEKLTTAANSARNSLFAFTRTCFVKIYARRQNSEAVIPNVAAIAVNRDNKIFQSKPRDEISVLTRLPVGEYEITTAKPGFESAVNKFKVECDANDREQELKVRLKLRGSGETNVIKTISKRVLNSEATSLPDAQFPAAARAINAGGEVKVEVLIDENGNVISAKAVSGHTLLRPAAEAAARRAKFKPIFLPGQPVRVSGILIYKFVL